MAIIRMAALSACAFLSASFGAKADSLCLLNHPRSPEKIIEACTNEIGDREEPVENGLGSRVAIHYHSVFGGPELSHLLITRGNAYLALGQYDAATTDYSNALQNNPKNTTILINRGATYMFQKKYDLALADYNTALETLTGRLRSSALTDRSGLYLRQKKFDLALADANEAIKNSPDALTLYNDRAYVYRLKGDLDSAYADFSYVLQKDRNDTRASIGVALIRLDRLDYAGALQGLNSALEDNKATVLFSARCYTLGVLKQSLDTEIDDCNKGVEAARNYSVALAARAFMELQLVTIKTLTKTTMPLPRRSLL